MVSENPSELSKSMSNVSKEIIVESPGMDQLQRTVGTPVPGDIVKLHITASYVSVGGAETVFLTSRNSGNTAFYAATIPPVGMTPVTADDIVARMAQTMQLGETARFVLQVTSFDDPIKEFFSREKLHKGQERFPPKDAVQIVIELESFRIVRWHQSSETRIEHLRPPRNVRAA